MRTCETLHTELIQVLSRWVGHLEYTLSGTSLAEVTGPARDDVPGHLSKRNGDELFVRVSEKRGKEQHPHTQTATREPTNKRADNLLFAGSSEAEVGRSPPAPRYPKDRG